MYTYTYTYIDLMLSPSFQFPQTKKMGHAVSLQIIGVPPPIPQDPIPPTPANSTIQLLFIMQYG